MSKTVIACVAGVVLGAAISVVAQTPPTRRVMFEQVAGRSFGTPLDEVPRYEGRADMLTQAGTVTMYRGHVAISFPRDRVVIYADQVTSDRATDDLALQGNVRIALDWRLRGK